VQHSTTIEVDQADKAVVPEQPRLPEVLALVCLTNMLFLAVMFTLSSYPRLVDNFGDGPAYMAVSSAIRHWSFQGLGVKQFWGLPYVMALVSTVTRISDRASLLLVSELSSIAAIILAYKLWGGWVAGFFAVLNFEWMERSLLGGSEPLFVALLFGSFLAARRQYWLWAALLAACATVVRPVGIFALLAIGLTMLWQRNFAKLALAVLIGAAIGVLYMTPLALYLHDPLATVHSYQQRDWDQGSFLGFPFQAIVKGTLHQSAPWTNILLTYGWIFFVLAGGIAMLVVGSFRNYAKAHPVETIFASSYLVFLYTYNSPHWAGAEFSRFAIPVIPFVLLALEHCIPRNRILLWGIGSVSPILAAASALGIRNVIGIWHR
jgi:hypothetical protein